MEIHMFKLKNVILLTTTISLATHAQEYKAIAYRHYNDKNFYDEITIKKNGTLHAQGLIFVSETEAEQKRLHTYLNNITEIEQILEGVENVYCPGIMKDQAYENRLKFYHDRIAHAKTLDTPGQQQEILKMISEGPKIINDQDLYTIIQAESKGKNLLEIIASSTEQRLKEYEQRQRESVENRGIVIMYGSGVVALGYSALRLLGIIK